MNLADQVVLVAMAAFNQASSLTNLFVVPLVLGRIAYLNATGSPSSEYTRLAKGVVLYFCLITGFETILKILVTLPEHLAPAFASFPTSTTDSNHVSGENGKIIPSVLTWTLESLIIVLYHAATFFNFAIAILLSAMAPVVFLLSGILNIGLGVDTFFSLLVMVSAWPIIFTACEAMRQQLMPMLPPGIAETVSELIIAFFKLAGPLAVAKMAIQSHAGQAIRSAVSTGGAMTGMTANHAVNLYDGFKGKPFNPQPRTLTQMAYEGKGRAIHSSASALRNLTGNPATKPNESVKHNRYNPNLDRRNL